MINTCIMCGKKFKATKSTKLYCSRACGDKARSLRTKNETNSARALDHERTCLICGKSFKLINKSANGRQCCYECMPAGTQLKRGDFLKKIKLQRGGSCVRCGYNKCIKALEFHHPDPTQKDFTISNDHFKLVEAVEESKKCILLCANCHRELHDNMWELNELNSEVLNEVNG